MQYDFDGLIERSGTDSLTAEGWREYMFGDCQGDIPSEPPGGFINLWVADMAFSTPPEVLEAIRARLSQKIIGYTKAYHPGGLLSFENWCERHYGYCFPRESIVLSPGVIPALYRLVPLLTRQDESILILTPSYAPFKKAGEYSDRRVISCPLKSNGEYMTVDFDAMRNLVQDKTLRIKAFFLCNPHNPTGRVWHPDELRRMMEMCLENDVWIISDEIHCDLTRIGISHTPAASLFPHSQKIITCMSSSKTFNLAGNLLANVMIPDPGVRTAWLRLHDEFVSPLSLAANIAAWSQCDEWLLQVKRYIDGNFLFLSEWLKKHLPRVRYSIPEGTYLAWIDLTPLSAQDEPKFTSHFFAEKAGVLVEDGSMFVGNGDNHIRLNLACPRAVLSEGLLRIYLALTAST